MIDFARQEAIRQSVAARTAVPSNGGEASAEKAPRTFAELLKGGGVKAATCRCGATATMALQTSARPLRENDSGTATMALQTSARPLRENDSGKRNGMAAAIASHTVKLCEPCAVELFAAFREQTR
jgi:hypothetical protein